MTEENTITETPNEPDATGSEPDPSVDGGEVQPVAEPETSPQTAGPSAPSVTSATGGSGTASDVRTADVIDIDAELTAKEALADQFEKGDITYEQFAKQSVKHDRRITQAQRELAKPAQEVQQTIQEQRAVKAYWQNWGKGQDVAQFQYGKTVTSARAKAIYAQVEAEFEANPRYQRPEFQRNRDALIYDKFCDALGTEATKKPGSPQQRQNTGTRSSGSGGASASAVIESNKTARQRHQDGEIDIGADAQRLGMI